MRRHRLTHQGREPATFRRRRRLASKSFIDVGFTGWTVGEYKQFPVKYKGHVLYDQRGKPERGDVDVFNLPIAFSGRRGHFPVRIHKVVKGSAGTLQLPTLKSEHISRLMKSLRKVVGPDFDQDLVGFDVTVRKVYSNTKLKVVPRAPRHIVVKEISLDIFALYKSIDEYDDLFTDLPTMTGLDYKGIFVPDHGFTKAWSDLVEEAIED